MQDMFPSNSIYSNIPNSRFVSLKIGAKSQVSYIIIMLTQTILNCYSSFFG